MKKLLLFGLIALGLGGLASRAGAVANQARELADAVLVPLDKNGKQLNLDWVGVAVSSRNSDGTRVRQSAGAENVDKQWTNQPGVLYDIEMASGTALTEYVICVDTDNTSGTDLQAGPTNANLDILLVCHRSNGESSQCFAADTNVGYRPWPRFFRDGLACRSSTDAPYWPLFREAD